MKIKTIEIKTGTLKNPKIKKLRCYVIEQQIGNGDNTCYLYVPVPKVMRDATSKKTEPAKTATKEFIKRSIVVGQPIVKSGSKLSTVRVLEYLDHALYVGALSQETFIKALQHESV